MFTLSELTRKPVVAVDSAEQLGSISGVKIDPATRLITAMAIGGKKGGVIGREAVRAVAGDVVTLTSADAVHEAVDASEQDLLAGRFDLRKKRVLTTAGFDVGQVRDAEFDDDGTLTVLLTTTQAVPGAALRGIGSYAVVVEHPAEGTYPH